MRRLRACAVFALTLALAGAMLSAGAEARTAHKSRAARPAAAPVLPPQFTQTLFASGTSTLFNPDGIVVTKTSVYVDYQNASDTSPAPSTIARYNFGGSLLATVNIAGRCDGLRLNPATGKLWALVNNDGENGSPPRQPALFILDPTSLAATKYAFAQTTQEHGGGYDDLAFIGGKAFFSASSPTLTASGVNTHQIAVEAKLSGTTVVTAPIAFSNRGGLGNITDPDSLAVDNAGDLLIVSEGDGQLVTVRNPGTSSEVLSSIATGTHLDDIAVTTGTRGTFWVADTTLDRIYRIHATFPAGSVAAEAPLGAPVQSFIGGLDLTTGTLTPYLTGVNSIVNPTSLVFVPDAS